ncbi:DUF4332 domain-containing protein [Haloferula sp.]|uniref:DUF4332 domain-containing protein n=1 Tax=Haloferula sp. TaxID=2497595 RepID=UPI00329AF0E7
MQTLETIKGIKPDDRELLEAAGWVDPRQLAHAQADDLLAEIEKANGVLKLVDRVPKVDAVEAWIVAAQELTGELPDEQDEPVEAEPESIDLQKSVSSDPGNEEAAEPTGPVNYEEDPDVQDMLKLAPLAIPIPNHLLAEEGISPAAISIAPVLNCADSDLEVRVTSKQRSKTAEVSSKAPKGKHAGVVKVADSGRSTISGAKKKLDQARVRKMDQPEEAPEYSRKGMKRETREDRLNLLRTTREKTNRGKKPGTRSYIRGVLHDRPYKVWFGCLVVILFQFTVPLAILSAALLIIDEHSSTKLEWVPDWIIVFPLALPVLGLLYFMMSFGVKCRVCGQKVLVHRHCRKNTKAHHIPGLGYVLPLAVQTLLFRWFNCTFCGTSIRIKE